MLGFRKLEGINLNAFKEKFGVCIKEAYPVVNELLEKGDLVIDNEFIKVPSDKIYVLNSILINFLNEDYDKAKEYTPLTDEDVEKIIDEEEKKLEEIDSIVNE